MHHGKIYLEFLADYQLVCVKCIWLGFWLIGQTENCLTSY